MPKPKRARPAYVDEASQHSLSGGESEGIGIRRRSTQPRSRVWHAFEVVGTHAVCKVRVPKPTGDEACGKQYLYNKGGPTNVLWDHLWRKHRDVHVYVIVVHPDEIIVCLALDCWRALQMWRKRILFTNQSMCAIWRPPLNSRCFGFFLNCRLTLTFFCRRWLIGTLLIGFVKGAGRWLVGWIQNSKDI